MAKLVIGLVLGAVAGLLDTGPMLMRGVAFGHVAQAFTHWMATGVLIVYAQMPLPSWAKGIAVALLTSLPVLVERASVAPSSTLGVLTMSVVLGALVGLVGERLLRSQ